MGAQEGIMDTPGRRDQIRRLERRILCRIKEYQKVDTVEGSTPSEAQEVMAQEEPGMGSPGHPKS
jgi:hypothetical protein